MQLQAVSQSTTGSATTWLGCGGLSVLGLGLLGGLDGTDVGQSLSFICKMGINHSQRIQWDKTHSGPTQSGRGSLHLKGKVLLAGSDWAWGPWLVLLLVNASGQTLVGFYRVLSG